MRPRGVPTRRLLLLLLATEVSLAGLRSRVFAAPPPPDWETLEEGLELGTFAGPAVPTLGDGKIHVLRIDPARFELALLNASAPGEGASKTARAWAEGAGAVAAINASMFATDGKTSVSLMRTRRHVNNATASKDNAVLAFDADPGAKVPPVQILDRTCQDHAALSRSYGSLVQSIRMIDCDGKTVWSKQPKKWSTAAIATDTRGRVLFLHARSPWPVHDFTNRVRALPLAVNRLMYVEGGPEATLYVKAGGRVIERVGSFETGFNENDDNVEAWPVPNVIAVVRKGS